MGQNKRMEGSRYEQLAARYLEQKGMDVLELNYRCRTGEIEHHCQERRISGLCGGQIQENEKGRIALEAIDSRKAGQVRRVAAVYLYEHGFPESRPAGLTPVGIDGEQITHLKNAF